MPKPLREPQPTSSVARLLDLDAAARAVRKQPSDTEPSRQTYHLGPQLAAAPISPSTGETPRIKRELVLTHSADQAFTRLVEVYHQATGTRLTASHVARAMFKGVAHCMDQLERHAKKNGPLRLPSNARGRELERERFEARIADAFIAGIRASAALDDTSCE